MTDVGRIIRFGLTGAATTAVVYAVFAGMIRLGLEYEWAAVGSWFVGVAASFALHRRVTFGIRTPERRLRDLGVFFIGSILQLLIGLAGYAVMIGSLRWAPTPAFLVNLCLTSASSFLFMRFVTFRRAQTAVKMTAVGRA